MEKVGYGKWAIWMAITMLLSLLPDNVIAQPGFVSVDCGGKENYTDENNITWVTDANYIDVGETADTGNATSPSHLQSLRFFPKPLNKSCYRLPVAPNVPHLLRLWFALGNYSKFSASSASFTLTIETSGFLIYTNYSYIGDPFSREGIYVSSGIVLYICLIRTSDTYDPFINAIELRALQNGMYGQAKLGTMLYLQSRVNVGGNSIVRYPLDKFDRIWSSHINLADSSIVRYVSSEESISTKNTKNLPPTAVMQTAWVMNVNDFSTSLTTASWAKSVLLIYLAEIERFNTSESRSFYLTINGEDRSKTISLVRNYSALELTFVSNETDKFIFDLVKAPNSTSRPILNAFEYYTIHHTGRATSSQDIEALDAIKSKYGIKDWISDPCFFIPWNGLGCVNSSLVNRISEINLSGRNLKGSVLQEIGQLTALVNVSLDNNHLIGPLPNLSSLTMLERIYLQNNSLIGTVPEWLFELKKLKELSLDNNHLIGPLPNFSSLTTLEVLHLQNNNLTGSVPDWLLKLKNLKELFIQNNNFSGVIPAELLDKSSLNVKFSGNSYLCVSKAGECIQEIQESRNNSKNVVLGVTISVCLGIALALMVGIALYRRSQKRRLNKDYPLILSKLKNCRAFTEKEMMDATQKFSRRIGQGGSGSVFLGTLRNDEDIAVKVIQYEFLKQFENEVDVLSRAQHKNLVSLLGYCSEPKNLMLIYEHMSGGSLWDSLHGPSAGNSNLNWKTRLKIALDAAKGLEFFHVGCTPKIIHRDVKSANILLDHNMNAKLADFGISRITRDGEATHATTSMVKGTLGYIDPEYGRTHKVTDKSDVYSFGVVLFEIICGRPATHASHEEYINLVEWVTPYVNGKEVGAEIIDERLDGNYEMKSIACVAKLALRCVEDKPNRRPSISDVVGEIKEAIIHENKTNAQIPVSEGIGSEYGDLQAPVRSQVDSGESKDMERVDDRSKENECKLIDNHSTNKVD